MSEIIEAEKVIEVVSLPELSIKLVGKVASSNLVEYKKTALEFIESINTDLKTDDDFIEADKAIKFCANAEKALKKAKEQALSETSDIALLFETVDELIASLSGKRLPLTKLAKTRKDAIKDTAIDNANKALTSHLNDLATDIKPILLPWIESGFIASVKGLKTVKSIKAAINKRLSECKAKADGYKKHISFNLVSLSELASEHRFLFNDLQQIIMNDHNHFSLIVRTRVSEYVVEEKRKADEKLKIEEDAKTETAKEPVVDDEKPETSNVSLNDVLDAAASSGISEGFRSFGGGSGSATRNPDVDQSKDDDEAHRATVDKAIIAAFVKFGVPGNIASMMVVPMAKGHIPKVSINY